MTATQYLESLIAGLEMGSTLPVQLSELKLLQVMLLAEASGKNIFQGE